MRVLPGVPDADVLAGPLLTQRLEAIGPELLLEACLQHLGWATLPGPALLLLTQRVLVPDTALRLAGGFLSAVLLPVVAGLVENPLLLLHSLLSAHSTMQICCIGRA